MDEKLSLRLLAIFVALHSVAPGHVFFHEPSAILMKPSGLFEPDSDFGFAMGFWNDSMVVSSPSSGLNGEVFRCLLDGEPSNSLNCSSLDLFKSNTYSRDLNPTQKFYLGASIATTKDYLFLSSGVILGTKNNSIGMRKIIFIDKHPEDHFWSIDKLINLCTKHIKRVNEHFLDAIGSCFVYANNTSVEYKGPEEKFQDDGIITGIQGGTGWNTLADEENGFLLVAKTSVYGNINYLSTSNALEKPKSLSESELKALKQDILDMGYGIAAGKFFSNKTVYAVSKQSWAMTGQIFFLDAEVTVKQNRNRRMKSIVTRKLKLKLKDNTKSAYMITNTVVGAMFGYSLASADLNSDGLSDLLVGAPLQSEDINEVEFGALHIYWDIEKNLDENIVRTIFGTKSMGRFGTTIAVSDIDGDSNPEVFVSAPYEDNGVVYILSGHALKKLLQPSSSQSIQVSELDHTQKVVQSDQALFGFSLLPLPDVDGNGCNDLAIGAPGANTALILRSFQTINVTISLELLGLSVKEKDDNFTVKVCLRIGYNTKSNITGYLSVRNDIDGSANVTTPSYRVELSERKEIHCTDVIVNFLIHEKADYIFRTNLKLKNIKPLESKDFDKTWVQLSTYSETRSSLPIYRRCSGDDCNPLLSLQTKWNHSDTTQVYASKGNKKATYERRWYDVESSEVEMVSVVVENKGFETSQACVWVEITGAPVYKPGLCSPKPPQNPKGYECTLPTPFRRGEETTFEILLNMSRLSNADKALVVVARPYEYCHQKSNHSEEKILKVNYGFKEAWQKVLLDGEKHDLLITDLEISEEELVKNDENDGAKENIFKDDQQYRIMNNGSVMWHSIAVIEVENRPFITKVGTTEEHCTELKHENRYEISCPLALPPSAVKNIIAWAEMSRKEVGENLNGGRRINVTSQMKIFMDSPSESAEFIHKSLVTDIKMKKDISFKNSKMMIGLIAGILALLLLALVTCILMKNGFFKREEKKKLNVLRESVRRHSIRIASEKSSRYSHKSPSNADDHNDIDIEVIDDSPFEEIPISSKDNTMLIESQAEVHQNGEDGKKGREENAKKA